MTRWPFADLARAMGLTEHQACEQLGLRGSTAQDYRRRGVTEKVADRLANLAGLHPFEVWPAMADQAVAEATRTCDGCGAPFVPYRPTHRWCSTGCRTRAAKRRYHAAHQPDPTYRARRQEQRRTYYLECGDYERARQRIYDRRRREAA